MSDELQQMVASAIELLPLDANGNFVYHCESVSEAKALLKRVRHSQKQLKQAKKMVRVEEKNIRSAFSTKQAMVGANLGSAVHSLIFGRKASGKLNSLNRESLRLQKNQSLIPIENCVKSIDKMLLDLDRAVLQIGSWILQKEE